MAPKPVQKPRPPIWMGVGHPDALRRTAAIADGWMGSGGSSNAAFMRSVPLLREALEKAGRDPATFPISKRVFLSVHERPEVARAELHRWFTVVYRNPEGTDASGIHGTPEQVRERLEELVAAGANHLLLNPIARYAEQLEMLAEVVGLVERIPLSALGAAPEGRRGARMPSRGYRMTDRSNRSGQAAGRRPLGPARARISTRISGTASAPRRSAPPGTASSISCWPGGAPLDALDAGCGTGFLSLELAARGHRVTGVDFAPAMLAEARRKAAERGVSIRFEEADAEQLPFRDRQLRPCRQPACAVDLAAPGGGDRRMDPRAAAGRAARRHRRAVRPGRLDPSARECPDQRRIRGDRRSAAVSRRPAARGDRSAVHARTASSMSAATRCSIWSRRRRSAWSRRAGSGRRAGATSPGARLRPELSGHAAARPVDHLSRPADQRL